MTTAKHKIALRITSKARNEILMKLVDRFESNYGTYKSLSYNKEDLKIDL